MNKITLVLSIQRIYEKPTKAINNLDKKKKKFFLLHSEQSPYHNEDLITRNNRAPSSFLLLAPVSPHSRRLLPSFSECPQRIYFSPHEGNPNASDASFTDSRRKRRVRLEDKANAG